MNSIIQIKTKAILPIIILFMLFSAQTFSQSWAPVGGGTGWEYAVCVYNGELYAGGVFGIMKWDGASWTTPGGGITGEVDAMVVYNGKLIAGGSFVSAGGLSIPYIAQWDGTAWTDLGGSPNSIVHALTVCNGILYVGGYFTQVENMTVNHIAEYNIDHWGAVGSGTGGSQGQVMALTSYNSKIVAGGFFTSPASHIAIWDGNAWSSLGSGISGIVYTLGNYHGNLIAGGLFSSAGGISASDIASWNGTSWSALGSGCGGGFYPYVFTLTEYGNDLYAGGLYTIAGGQTVNGIAKWNGSTWSGLGSGFWNGGSNVYGAETSCIYNNKLVCGGIFSSAGGVGAGNIAQWDGLALTGLTNHNNNKPDKFELSQNYPNPFNPSTKIKYQIPVSENVKLSVFDITGKEIALLVNEKQAAGAYEISWKADGFSTGVYFYRIISGNYSETKRMLMIK